MWLLKRNEVLFLLLLIRKLYAYVLNMNHVSNSVGSGLELIGFCLEDKLRIRVSSGLNISVMFGFRFKLSGL